MTAPNDYYELSVKLGRLLCSSGLVGRKWDCSTSAQLHLLLSVAESLGFAGAVEIIRPLVDARTNNAGDLMPDSGWNG
jgi:hypothetical protein